MTAPSSSLPDSPAPADLTPERSDVPQVAPVTRLSPRMLTILLVSSCLIPLIGLSVYAAFFGRASDAPLDVEVFVGKEPVEAFGSQGAILTEVVAIKNVTGHELPNLTVDLNGQYFLHRQSPVAADERLVLPQQIFATKSNQRWVPGAYPLKEITVTAKLPSGRRGVKIVTFE